MMINERLQKFLKEAKIKLMIGGVLGAVTLGGGAATVSYAQDNNVATEVEYNTDVNLEDKIQYDLPLYGYLLENGKYDIGLDGSIIQNIEEEDYIYDMYMVDDLGNVIKTICENASLDYVNGMLDAGKYYAVIKDKNTNETYAKTSVIDTKVFQSVSGTIDAKLDLPIGGYKLSGGIYDISVGSLETLPNIKNYVYDMYMVDDLGKVIKEVSTDVPCGTVTVAKENGKYYAIIKEKDTKKVYGQTLILDTTSLKFGGYFGEEANKYEYAEQIMDYISGRLTLRDATKIGGANKFLYDGIARGISLETGLDFEQVRDTMINLNLDIICEDPMQLDILYPEGVNYTRLHENTDQTLYKTITDAHFELSKFAGSDIDFEVVSELDQIYLKHCNTLSVTSYDSQQLIKCFNFCFGRDEINGHKFEDLGSCGKRLALVYYQRMKNLMSKTYNVCTENDIAMSDEYIKVYQAIEPVTVLSVAKNVGAADLIKNYYYLNLDSLKEEQASFDYYTVKPGDVLWKIALDNGMLPQEFYDLNRDIIGDNANLIYPGQKLKVKPTHDFESKTK